MNCLFQLETSYRHTPHYFGTAECTDGGMRVRNRARNFRKGRLGNFPHILQFSSTPSSKWVIVIRIQQTLCGLYTFHWRERNALHVGLHTTSKWRLLWTYSWPSDVWGDSKILELFGTTNLASTIKLPTLCKDRITSILKVFQELWIYILKNNFIL